MVGVNLDGIEGVKSFLCVVVVISLENRKLLCVCPRCKEPITSTENTVVCPKCGAVGKRKMWFDAGYPFAENDRADVLKINPSWYLEPSGKKPDYDSKLWSKQPQFAVNKMKEIEETIDVGVLYPPILEVLKLASKDESILDVGCAGGHYYRTLQYHLGAIDYTGCDITPEYIKFARERFPEKTWLEADVRRLPFPDKSFDYVLCLFVLVHLSQEDMAQALRELTRVARKQVLFSGYFSIVRIPGHQLGDTGDAIYDIIDIKEMEVEGWRLEADTGNPKYLPAPVRAEMESGEIIEATGGLPILSYVRLVRQ